MAKSVRKKTDRQGKAVPKKGSSSSYTRYNRRMPKPSLASTAAPPQGEQGQGRSVEAAQAEFLQDLRIGLEQMKTGAALPAEEALRLIDLNLDVDDLERSLRE